MTIASLNGLPVGNIANFAGIAKALVASVGGDPLPSSGGSAVVSGAGTAAANGSYTPRSENLWNLVGHPDSPTQFAITGDPSEWDLYDGSGNVLYVSDNSPGDPWLAPGWNTNEGDDPPPTVTEG